MMYYCECQRCGERLDNGGIFHLIMTRLDCKTLPEAQANTTALILCEQCADTIGEVVDDDSVK